MLNFTPSEALSAIQGWWKEQCKPNKNKTMRKELLQKIAILIALLLTCLATWGQNAHHGIGFRAGLMDIRGETTQDIMEVSQVGVEGSVLHYYRFEDARWMWINELQMHREDVSHNFGSKQKPQFYAARVHSVSMATGIRFNFNNALNYYHSYEGLTSPFVGLHAGIAGSEAAQDQTPEAFPTAFTPNTERVYGYFGELTIGLSVAMGARYSLELYSGVRYFNNDDLDGLAGVTEVDDVIVRLGLGLTYRFQ